MFMNIMIMFLYMAAFMLLVALVDGVLTVIRFMKYRRDQKRFIENRVREDMMEYRANIEQIEHIERVIRREAGREFRKNNSFEL